MGIRIVVTLPYDPHWKALEWAKKNCSSYITNRASKRRKIDLGSTHFQKVTHIDYYFSDEKDAAMFALRWS